MQNKNMSVKYNQSRTANKGVKVGDRAPDFTLPSLTGESVSLESFLVKKISYSTSILKIILLAVPLKHALSGIVMKSFRRLALKSSASVPTLRRRTSSLRINTHLPFILLSDLGGVVRKFYGVPSTFGLLPGRVTYIIDKKGIVRHIFSSQFAPQMHVTEALKVLNELNEEEKSKDQA